MMPYKRSVMRAVRHDPRPPKEWVGEMLHAGRWTGLMVIRGRGLVQPATLDDTMQHICEVRRIDREMNMGSWTYRARNVVTDSIIMVA